MSTEELHEWRSQNVLQLLSSGKTSKEVSKQLFISETTVITHRERLKKKLRCKNSFELAYKAGELGLIKKS